MLVKIKTNDSGQVCRVNGGDSIGLTVDVYRGDILTGQVRVELEFKDELPESRADVDEGKLQGECVLSSGAEGDGRDEVKGRWFMERWDDDGGALG